MINYRVQQFQPLVKSKKHLSQYHLAHSLRRYILNQLLRHHSNLWFQNGDLLQELLAEDLSMYVHIFIAL